MSQIVEGYPGEPRVLKERPPGAVYKVVAANWGSSSGCKDPLCTTISLYVLLQGFLCHSGQRNGAVALGRFWGGCLASQAKACKRGPQGTDGGSWDHRPYHYE